MYSMIAIPISQSSLTAEISRDTKLTGSTEVLEELYIRFILRLGLISYYSIRLCSSTSLKI